MATIITCHSLIQDLGTQEIHRSNSDANLASSDNMSEFETKPEISLDDVDQPRAWRVGWPRLCRSRVQTLYREDATSMSKSSVEALGSQINTILSRYQIEHRQFPGIALWLGPVYRTNVKYQEGPPNEHRSILVECVFNAERHKEDPLSWPNAVIDIHKALYDIISNPCSIGVELCDTVCEKSLFLTDLPSGSEEFRKNWDGGSRYRQQILEKLKKWQAPWQAMVPAGLTASNEYMEGHICVVWIHAQNANDSIWVQIQRDLQSILPDSISVEIWQASNHILSSSYEALKTQPSDDGNIGEVKGATLPRPGSSLGCRGEKSVGGTLGGYIKVRIPSDNKKQFKKVTYALTSSHVVLRSKPHLWRGIQSTTQAHYPSQGIPVQSPYEKDRINILGSLRKAKEQISKRIASRHDELDYLKEANEDVSSKQEQVQSMKYKLVGLEAHEAALHRDPSLGYVRAAALGSRSHNVSTFDNRLGMDIALIELIDPSSRPEKVFLPYHDNLPNDRALKNWDVCDLGSNTDSEDICIVGKYGAASGLTTGLLHGIKVDIKLNGFPDAVSAWVVRSPSIGECFTRPGDSGSFVFTTTFWEEKGYTKPSEVQCSPGKLTILGVLFSGSNDANFGYFIPFDAVKKEVEYLTGGEMIWPTMHNADAEYVRDILVLERTVERDDASCNYMGSFSFWQLCTFHFINWLRGQMFYFQLVQILFLALGSLIYGLFYWTLYS